MCIYIYMKYASPRNIRYAYMHANVECTFMKIIATLCKLKNKSRNGRSEPFFFLQLTLLFQGKDYLDFIPYTYWSSDNLSLNSLWNAIPIIMDRIRPGVNSSSPGKSRASSAIPRCLPLPCLLQKESSKIFRIICFLQQTVGFPRTMHIQKPNVFNFESQPSPRPC